jgi:peptidoglycan hydrolase-like protein with peptidoglycan-binding domain
MPDRGQEKHMLKSIVAAAALVGGLSAITPAAADSGEAEAGKQPPFYLGPVTVNVMPPSLLAAQKELVFWDSIKHSTDPRDFEDFLKRFPDSAFAALAQRRLAALKPAPASARSSQAPAEGEAGWTNSERREVQRALRTLGHYPGEPDGGFGPGTRAAIKEFESFEGFPESGTLSDAERQRLFDLAQFLAAIVDQAPASPEGVAAAAVRGAEARYGRGWAAENGAGARRDPAEAVYWYALNSGDGQSRAATNLGTLLVRGQGWRMPTRPRPRSYGTSPPPTASRSRCTILACSTSAVSVSPPIPPRRGPGTTAPPRTTTAAPARR